MEKFGMSFGGGPSRKELLDTVESQKKQLVQYQTRFKDVVQAYKSLLKEKEALEASLKVLSVTQCVDLNQQEPCTQLDLSEDRGSLHSEDSLDTPTQTIRGGQSHHTQLDGAGASPEDTKSDNEDGASVARGSEPQQDPSPVLKGQLSTLTAALATVTQEKSRMEANFQADKRQLKQEVEELQERLVTVTSQQETELLALQQQLAEGRARIITQQHEREQEQSDHGQQLRELQRLLQEERGLRQDGELRLQDTNATLVCISQAADRGLESEALLLQVRGERDLLRRRLHTAEEEKKKPDPHIQELQQELRDLKVQMQDQVQTQTLQVCEAEDQARERAQSAETRVAVLEQRVSELSELLGSNEKARQRDQAVAQRLRDRLLQLDAENKTLAMAASSRASGGDLDDAKLDVNALRDKLQVVRKLLQCAVQNNPELNLQDVEADPAGEQASVLAYQQELTQVKEEFERYKLRAQVVLKNKHAKDGSQARQLEEVRDQLSELREKYINLRIQSDQSEERHRQLLEEQQLLAAEVTLTHRQGAEREVALHREELLRLEAELHKQRERTMALLDDKDSELERFRAAAFTCSARAEESKLQSDSVGEALLQATPTESTLVVYAEQLARKEAEAGVLRRKKHQLEDDMHQLQAQLVADSECHNEEEKQLRSQVDALLREQRREGANVEYLKNIIYRYLTLKDTRGRQQTLSAILTILHFSPLEKQEVFRLQAPPWWR